MLSLYIIGTSKLNILPLKLSEVFYEANIASCNKINTFDARNKGICHIIKN